MGFSDSSEEEESPYLLVLLLQQPFLLIPLLLASSPPESARRPPTQCCRDFLTGVIFHFKKSSWAVRVDVATFNVVRGTAPVILRIMRNVARAPTKPIQVARYALMAIFRPILLAALAFAVMASSVPISASALSDVLAAGAGPGRVTAGAAGAGRVTRLVCAHCTSTGKLSSRGLILNRAAVRRHIAASKPCHAAEAGIRTIQVEEAQAGDVMAGAGGAAGPAPDVRLQPAGDVHPQFGINLTNTIRKSYEHQRWWCSGMNSCAVCMRFWV